MTGTALKEDAPPGPASAPPRTPGRGLRLTALTGCRFTDHTQPLVGWKDSESALDVLRDCLPDLATGDVRAARGTSMITMSRTLLADAGIARPGEALDSEKGFDTVLLAYPAPDLFHAEVAGCWLSDRLPGAPVPSSVDQPGPGAVFTALRIADGLARLGELHRAMVLGFDQNALTRLRGEGTEPDAAILVLVGLENSGESALSGGSDGGLVVRRLGDDQAGNDPSAVAAALAGLVAETVPGQVILGRGLAGSAAAVRAGFGPGTRVSVAPSPGCTGVWTALAALAPVTGPVLLADHDLIGGRLYHCLVVPEAGR